MSGIGRRARRGALGVAVATLVAAAVSGPAHGALPAAPAALPQMWAVEVDAAVLRMLDRPLLRRLRAARATLVTAPGMTARQRRRLERLARRTGLPAFRPLAAPDPPARGTACRQRTRARPGTRCAVRARSARHARALARDRSVDVVVVRLAGPRAFARTAPRGDGGRVLGVLRLRGRDAGSRRWRRAMSAARRSARLDVAVRPQGRGALVRFLALVRRSARGDRVPPRAPGRPGVAARTGASVTLAWRASRGSAGYGLYRDGARAGRARSPRARLGRLGCGGHLLEVDAVDRAGNRSRKRFVVARPEGCAGVAPGAPRPGGVPPVPPRRPTLPPAVPPPDYAPASVFVAPGGSDSNSCSRPAPCATFDRAYRAAAPGQIVEVAGGAYPQQTIVAVDGRTGPNVVFRPAAGAQVVLDGLEFGDGGERSTGPDHITVWGMQTAFKAGEPGAGNQEGVSVGPGSSHIRLEDLDAGSVHTWAADHVTVRGGDFGPCHAIAGAQNVCGNNMLDVSSNVLIDGATFHDYRFDESCFTAPGADCHWECMYVNGSRNTTIRNSRFRGCAIFDIFATISGPDAAAMGHRNLTIENNWFAAPWTESPGGGSAGRPTAVSLAWCQSSPLGYRDVWVGFNSFASNTHLQIDRNPECVFENVQVVANLMMWDGCQPRWSYAHNVWSTAWRTGTCSALDRIHGRALPYVDGGQGAAMDYHLAGASAADDLVPAALCPPADIDGQPRPAAGRCDAGADEH